MLAGRTRMQGRRRRRVCGAHHRQEALPHARKPPTVGRQSGGCGAEQRDAWRGSLRRSAAAKRGRRRCCGRRGREAAPPARGGEGRRASLRSRGRPCRLQRPPASRVRCPAVGCRGHRGCMRRGRAAGLAPPQRQRIALDATQRAARWRAQNACGPCRMASTHDPQRIAATHGRGRRVPQFNTPAGPFPPAAATDAIVGAILPTPQDQIAAPARTLMVAQHAPDEAAQCRVPPLAYPQQVRGPKHSTPRVGLGVLPWRFNTRLAGPGRTVRAAARGLPPLSVPPGTGSLSWGRGRRGRGGQTRLPTGPGFMVQEWPPQGGGIVAKRGWEQVGNRWSSVGAEGVSGTPAVKGD